MTRINRYVECTREQIINTLQIISELGLSRIIKNPKLSQDGYYSTITWENHVNGRHNSGKAFTTINQYVSIYETGAYHCILFDGSILRVFFRFNKNILEEESLLFWPAPITIPEDDIYELGMREAMNTYISLQDSMTTKLKMRSPIRLDYDSTRSGFEHPSTHLHIQHEECRMSVNRPCCFGTFIKLIFKNFYPDLMSKSLGEIDPLLFSGYEEQKNAIISI